MNTLAELANRWRVSAKTIRRWIESGAVRAMKAGRKYLVPDDEVQRCEKLMEQGRFM